MADRWSVRTNGTLAGLLLLPVLVWSVNYHATDGDLSFCLFKLLTGRPCYGCGVLRGLSAVLHGHIGAAIQLNPLNVVTIPLLGWFYVQQWIKWFNTRRRLQNHLSGTSIVLL